MKKAPAVVCDCNNVIVPVCTCYYLQWIDGALSCGSGQRAGDKPLVDSQASCLVAGSHRFLDLHRATGGKVRTSMGAEVCSATCNNIVKALDSS